MSSTAVTSVYQNTQDTQGYSLNELAGNSTEVEKKTKNKGTKERYNANSAWNTGSEYEKANCIYKQRITSTNSNYEALWDAKQITANYWHNHTEKTNETIT